MPKVAAILLRFTDDRFREQGWKNTTMQPWEKRKNNVDPGRAILVKTATLKRGNRIVSTTDHSATIGNDVPYAKPHNDGFHGMVTVKAHGRKRLQKVKKPYGLTRKGKPRMQTVLQPIGDIQVKSFTRNMNLPARKYMGESAMLRKEVKQLITEEVNKCFR